MYTTLGIRDLRSDLAAAVRRARSGERTVITDRGDPTIASVACQPHTYGWYIEARVPGALLPPG
ncbi:MAG: type II toxin-antitoxin system Phd/YefM family antitoxin, partial [Ilumatobacteraceae bacterium]